MSFATAAAAAAKQSAKPLTTILQQRQKHLKDKPNLYSSKTEEEEEADMRAS